MTFFDSGRPYVIKAVGKLGDPYIQVQGDVRLGKEGTRFYIAKAGEEDAYTITASSLGSPGLQVLAPLVPVYVGKEEEKCGIVRADSGSEATWYITERAEGYTITAKAPLPPSLVPGAAVYLVWDEQCSVGWKSSGGFIEEVPERALWLVEVPPYVEEVPPSVEACP